MNNPPTAVGGIPESVRGLSFRLNINNPSTAVGGILWISTKSRHDALSL